MVVDGCNSSECFQGIYADVFHSLQDVMNFTYSISRNPMPGAQLPNGTWIGQIGIEIQSNEHESLRSYQTASSRHKGLIM